MSGDIGGKVARLGFQLYRLAYYLLYKNASTTTKNKYYFIKLVGKIVNII